MTPTTLADAPKLVAAVDTKIRFSEGIPGFNEVRDWELVALVGLEPFHWLRAIEKKNLKLMVVEPHLVVDGYVPILSRTDQHRLSLSVDAPPLIFTIVTLWDDSSVTVNLKAPLVMNVKTMQGAQLVLDGQDWPMRHLIGNRTPA